MFSSLRKPELSPGAFGFHWNPLMKNLYRLASVLVNPEIRRPTETYYELGSKVHFALPRF